VSILDKPPAAEKPRQRQSPAAGAAPDEASLLRRALERLQAGQRRKAAALCRQILANAPHHRQALLLLGALEAEAADAGIAEALFSRALALHPGDFFALHNLARLCQRRGDNAGAVALFEQALARRPDFAPGFNDLGVSLHRTGRHTAALAALDRALAIDPAYAVAHGNRGRVLMDGGRAGEAVTAFRREIALAPRAGEAWYNLALAHDALDELADAETALRQALALEPGHVDAHFRLAVVLERRHRPAEAVTYCIAGARRQGVAVRRCLGGAAEARVLLLGAAGPCNLPTRALFDHRRFETIAVHLLPPGRDGTGSDELLERLPPYDIVFNAIADADRGAAFLAAAESVGRNLGRPLLNPPARVLRTRRDLTPSRLAGIAGLTVPRSRRLTRAELMAPAAADLAAPMLIRPCGSHGGTDLERLGGADALRAYLGRVPLDEFYLTDFHDYRSADGFCRKYRLIFVDREVFPYHLAIAKDWMIHYWRADMAPWMKREEEAFLADYRSVFAGRLGEAVREVAQRLDLDYGGMDCGITPDGSLVVFEANASMLVHLNDSREDFAYKHAYVPRIFDAVGALVMRHLAASAS
jgi:Flp pilus assembly protein TadD